MCKYLLESKKFLIHQNNRSLYNTNENKANHILECNK